MLIDRKGFQPVVCVNHGIERKASERKVFIDTKRIPELSGPGNFRKSFKKVVVRIFYTYSHRGYSVLRGVIALLTGLALIVWPDTAIRTLLLFLGCVFITTGVFSLVSLIRTKDSEGPGSFLSINGLITLLLGILLVSFPDFFVSFVMFFFGTVLVVLGAMQFLSLMSIQNGQVSPMQYLAPVLIFLSGVIIFVNPFRAAETIFLFFGFIALFYGLTELYNVWKFRRSYPGSGKHEEIQDAEIVEESSHSLEES